MDAKLKEIADRARPSNEAIVAEHWGSIKKLYTQDAGLVDAVRLFLAEEYNRRPAAGRPTEVMLYGYLKSALMQIALVQMQNKVMEWMEAGEIPQGKAE